MKQKEEFFVKLDGELYKKLFFVSEKETGSLNNHMLRLIRTNVQYYEKVHGKINAVDIAIPRADDKKEN